MDALICPVCKGVTTSSEKCSSCGLDMLSCLACGGLNPASNQVCLVCGEKLASRLLLDAGAAMTSPRKGTTPPAAVAVSPVVAWANRFVFWDQRVTDNFLSYARLPFGRNRNPRAFSKVQEAQAKPRNAEGHMTQAEDPIRENAPLSVASGVEPAFTARKGAVAGVARGCQVRQETQGAGNPWQILTFRLDRFDDAGRPLQSVPVEMRGRRLKGYINDGEWIEVPGNLNAGELLEIKRVRNLTTGSWVEVSRSWGWLRSLVFGPVFLAVVFLVLAVAFLVLMQGMNVLKVFWDFKR